MNLSALLSDFFNLSNKYNNLFKNYSCNNLCDLLYKLYTDTTVFNNLCDDDKKLLKIIFYNNFIPNYSNNLVNLHNLNINNNCIFNNNKLFSGGDPIHIEKINNIKDKIINYFNKLKLEYDNKILMNALYLYTKEHLLDKNTSFDNVNIFETMLSYISDKKKSSEFKNNIDNIIKEFNINTHNINKYNRSKNHNKSKDKDIKHKKSK